jgi:hypothetical protein
MDLVGCEWEDLYFYHESSEKSFFSRFRNGPHRRTNNNQHTTKASHAAGFASKEREIINELRSCQTIHEILRSARQ